MTKVLPGDVFIENLPSTSVTAPVFVPLTKTDAPMTGSPISSTTMPLTLLPPWAKAIPADNTAQNSVRNNFLIILFTLSN